MMPASMTDVISLPEMVPPSILGNIWLTDSTLHFTTAIKMRIAFLDR